MIFRLVKLPDNYYVIHHINNGLCIDANWDQDIIAKECIENDNNQKFYITPYFNERFHISQYISLYVILCPSEYQPPPPSDILHFSYLTLAPDSFISWVILFLTT